MLAAPSSSAGHTAASQKGSKAATDGTYEPCSAYFGFGKYEGALDVVEFDVADQNGHDGVHHTVATDTPVVFVLKNSKGETLDCTPTAIDKATWDAAMSNVNNSFNIGDPTLPAWPGPGHYAYPSVPFDPSVDNFGDVVAVSFKVISTPAEHTLVSPTAPKTLTQHYVFGANAAAYGVDPRVLGLIQSRAGAAAKSAFNDALQPCDNEDDVDFTTYLKAAIDALVTYVGATPSDDYYGCFALGQLNTESSLLLGLHQTVSYIEPIVLRLPEPATTTTGAPGTTTGAPGTTTSAPGTTTTVPGAPPKAVAATPLAVQPQYTG